MSDQYRRELAWLRFVEAHVTALGLHDTARRCVELRKRIQERWSRDAYRFG